ncbi:MAG TPA: flagellar motor switch protein FliG [Gammaproteobacteria bacterium]|nr:flagellar motor switch protein FliG [Gammaproteobacteria bacterium]
MADNPAVLEDNAKLSGIARAAILLMVLGDSEAAQVIKHLNTRETRQVSYEMTSLGNITTAQVQEVLKDFRDQVSYQTALGGQGTENYIRSILGKALGEDKARTLVSGILMGGDSNGIEELKWLEPRAIANMIHNEHPQTIAIVLSLLESEQAAEVLQSLPQNTRSDLMLRIANLEGVQPSALEELNDLLERQLTGANSSRLSTADIGGLKVAANILNQLDSTTETFIRDEVREQDEEIAEKIEELMFVFENLLDIDDRGIQTLMRDVPADRLALAMKGASEELKEKIFKNMSSRASELLRDDLENMGPVRLADVEASQKEIVAITRKLAEAGTIMLGGSGGEEFL